jgi:hypothetical protein
MSPCFSTQRPRPSRARQGPSTTAHYQWRYRTPTAPPTSPLPPLPAPVQRFVRRPTACPPGQRRPPDRRQPTPTQGSTAPPRWGGGGVQLARARSVTCPFLPASASAQALLIDAACCVRRDACCTHTLSSRALRRFFQSSTAAAASGLCFRARHDPVLTRAAYASSYRMQIGRPFAPGCLRAQSRAVRIATRLAEYAVFVVMCGVDPVIGPPRACTCFPSMHASMPYPAGGLGLPGLCASATPAIYMWTIPCGGG